MNEAQARKLETEIEWNGKANVCIHCGRVPETFYTVTGHDHTDDSIRWCICRERYSQSEKHALLKENAALRAEVERLKAHQCTPVCVFHEGEELRKLCKQLAESQLEAKRLRGVLVAVRDDLEIRMNMAEDDSLNISDSVLDQMLDAIDLSTSTDALDAYVAEKVMEAMK